MAGHNARLFAFVPFRWECWSRRDPV